MVVHLKDQPHTTSLHLLKALLENAKNDLLTHTHYPPSISARLVVNPNWQSISIGQHRLTRGMMAIQYTLPNWKWNQG